MMNISSLLSSMSEKDRAAFSAARASMQKTYIQTVALFGGVSAMDQSDSWWIDAIDQRIAQLMQRAGLSVPVILPTSEAVAATLPKASVEQLRTEDPLGADAGNVPQDAASEVIAGLGKNTVQRAAQQAAGTADT